MSIELWAAFALASCVLLVIPGPTILTVISYSVAHGNRARIPLIAAVALGDSTALALSLAGVGAVLVTSAWVFTAVKWVGGLYLIYLGIKLLLAKTSTLTLEKAGSVSSRWKLFGNTWLVTAFNPKGIIFFVAFLPQFIDTSAAVVPQLWILSITFVVLATLNATALRCFRCKRTTNVVITQGTASVQYWRWKFISPSWRLGTNCKAGDMIDNLYVDKKLASIYDVYCGWSEDRDLRVSNVYGDWAKLYFDQSESEEMVFVAHPNYFEKGHNNVSG